MATLLRLIKLGADALWPLLYPSRWTLPREACLMKKLMNQPDQYVDQMLEGIVAAHPELKRIAGTQVIVRAHPKAKVALVSGGGSGHEPAHAGYVGEGMLDAAVSGSVFTSPTPDQVLSAIRAVDQGQGVLLVIKNY